MRACTAKRTVNYKGKAFCKGARTATGAGWPHARRTRKKPCPPSCRCCDASNAYPQVPRGRPLPAGQVNQLMSLPVGEPGQLHLKVEQQPKKLGYVAHAPTGSGVCARRRMPAGGERTHRTDEGQQRPLKGSATSNRALFRWQHAARPASRQAAITSIKATAGGRAQDPSACLGREGQPGREASAGVSMGRLDRTRRVASSSSGRLRSSVAHIGSCGWEASTSPSLAAVMHRRPKAATVGASTAGHAAVTSRAAAVTRITAVVFAAEHTFSKAPRMSGPWSPASATSCGDSCISCPQSRTAAFAAAAAAGNPPGGSIRLLRWLTYLPPSCPTMWL